MITPPPGAVLAAKVTAAGALGFVPVVVHFRLFETLAKIGTAASSAEILEANNNERTVDEKAASPLCLKLVEDTLFVLSGQGFVDLISDNVFAPNAITHHWASQPSAPHGAMHFTTEVLLASAFLMPKLQATHFAYPFVDADTAYQHAFSLLGQKDLAQKHTYNIMEETGRMDSFNVFMDGKFGSFGTLPERLRRFDYDLDAAISGSGSDVVMVDIGGGTGAALLELKAVYPHLDASSLVVQEFQTDLQTLDSGITLQEWNFKTSPQPIRGALIYSLTHILHNNSDLEALKLLKKLVDAMEPHSRLLIHEFSKNTNYGNMHGTMIGLYAGRLRSREEWAAMAEVVGLKITFEVYPEVGEGLIEMKKVT
ncbi:hypothetical protein V494_06879 [Pseudogymnoascus sp. VKM F-4513 (FW-928)]|nr:hypothetical protein V494_06879 [Pseudogymnoascus sp. VKM F-4513 (FW-928)]